MNLFTDTPNPASKAVDMVALRKFAAEMRELYRTSKNYLSTQEAFRIARAENRTVRCSRCKDEMMCDTAAEAAQYRRNERWRCDDCLEDVVHIMTSRKKHNYNNRTVVGTRICPKCGKTLNYYTKGGLYTANRKNANCAICAKVGKTRKTDSVQFKYTQFV